MLSRTTSGLAPSRSIWLECMVRKLGKRRPDTGVPNMRRVAHFGVEACPVSARWGMDNALSLESAGAETPQVVARIPGQIGMRVCTCEICHRPTYACVHWG